MARKQFSTSALAPITLGDLVKADAFPEISTETVTLTGGNYPLGTVLGKITAGAVPATGVAGTNTGNGTCVSVTGGVEILPGIYAVKCVQSVADGRLFSVASPSGHLLGVANAGTPFVSPEIILTVTNGNTNYAVGDSFTVTVPAGSGHYAALNEAAIDGTYHAAAVLADDVDASAADYSGPAKARMVVLDADFLVWPAGIGDAHKAKALGQLNAAGIIVRTLQ